MRKIFFVMLACVAFCTAQAQRFEWVKGYDSSYDDAYIKGSVTDSLGNLYILGQIHWDSDWDQDEEPLCWQVTTENTMVLVAKISPEGDMVWKKMFANSGNGTFAYDIKPLGDTGFAVLFQDGPCNPYYHYRYWGDSLYRNIAHPLLVDAPDTALGYKFYPGGFTVYMSFDFDGNITEQHLLQLSYADTDGNSVITPPDSLHWMLFPVNSTFDVDADGNIYICREANDWIPPYASYNGTLGAVRYWIDHHLVGESPIENSPREWFPQLLKFSPHFDTLLASRYVVQKSDTICDGIQLYMKIDRDTGIYLLFFNQMNPSSNNIVVDSIVGLSFSHAPRHASSFLAIYDSQLQAKGVVSLADSVINPNLIHSTSLLFHGIDFDYDSNLFFITATTNRSAENDTSHFYSVLKYNGTALNLKGGSFFMSFEKDTYPPVLHSYGRVPARFTSGMSGKKKTIGQKVICKKNRLFLQTSYIGGLKLPNRNIILPNGKTGMGLIIFDYKGQVIGGFDYNVDRNNRDEHPEIITIRDSVLYLINTIKGPAQFGEIQIPSRGNYYECITKHVDTAFMATYGENLNEVLEIKTSCRLAVYPNPARDVLNLDLGGEILLHATAKSVLGQAWPVDVGISWVDVASLPAGTYLLEVETCRHNKYTTYFVKQ